MKIKSINQYLLSTSISTVGQVS